MTMTTMNTRSSFSRDGEDVDKVRARRLGENIHRGPDGVGSRLSTTLLMKVPSGPSSKLLILSTFLCANFATVYGHPIHGSEEAASRNNLHRFLPREMATKNIIPIAVVAGVALLLGIFILWKWNKACLSFLRRCREHVRNHEAVNYSTEPRELTAEQLAGSINGPGYAPRSRRGRRARRTNSQISTHSLPVYAKEPGEQELVVLQGPADMEDARVPQPLATVIDLGEEAEMDTNTGHIQQLDYSPMPDSSPSSPLLDRDVPADILSPNHQAISHRHSGSTGTGNESVDTSSLAHVEPVDRDNPASTLDRGEAPPYFEVVDAGHSVRRDITSAEPHSTSSSPAPGVMNSNSPPSSPRRVGLRSLLNRMSGSAASHVRNSSSVSGVSFQSHPRSHGRGPSVASVLRPLSRQRSHSSHSSRPNLSSPSMISLNSISAPLTHTAVRTGFTYPKGGLTADQMRMISSRDSLVRFGVPYGPDAVAFASLSRDNLVLGEMPPEFEEAVTPDSGSGDDTNANSNSVTGASEGENSRNVQPQEATTSSGVNQGTIVGGSAGSSANGLPAERAPAAVNVEGLPAIQDAREDDKAEGTQERSEQPEKEEQQIQNIGKSERVPQSASNPDPATPDHSKSGNSGDQGKAEALTTDKSSQLASEAEQEAIGPSPVGSTTPHDALSKTNSDMSIPSEVGTSNSMAENPIIAEVQPPTPLTGPTNTSPLTSSKAVPNELLSDAPRPAKPSAAPPPSSYHTISSPDYRPESRASQLSYASDATFRTAAESLSSRMRRNVSDDEDDDDDDAAHDEDYTPWERERSPTPTLGGKDISGHEREGTDTTVTVSTSDSRTSSLNRAKHMSTVTIRA